MFPIEKFKPIQRLNKSLVKRSVRYWDKAGTEDGGAYTAGVLVHEMKPDVEPAFVVEDVVHGQWSALTRERRIRQAAEFDKARYGYGYVTQWVEQEPGSGGKESAERTVRETLRGHAAFPDKVTGDKVTRAEPYAAQVEAGNVGIVVAEWNKPFLNEHEVFPNGTLTKDTVDAAAGAFHKLVGSTYDISLSWVGGPGQ
jgi:predicted phage terminase large subunit-like protein